jgi:hypothetical protein
MNKQWDIDKKLNIYGSKGHIQQAENILSEKLCRCIKKVDENDEKKSIAICTKTIFNRKGLKRGKFNCKVKDNKKQSVKITKKGGLQTRKNKSNKL